MRCVIPLLCSACLAAVVCGGAGCGRRVPVSTDAAASDGTAPPRDAAADAATMVDLAADAAPPAPDAGSYADEVARACAFAASCHGRGDLWRLAPSACVEAFSRLPWPGPGFWPGPDAKVAKRMLDCARKATDCGSLHACFGGSLVQPSACAEGAGCDKDRMTVFGAAGAQGPYFDCGVIGATCQELPTGAIRSCCVRHSCVGTQQTRCASSTVGSFCSLGIAFDVDCAPSGQVCRVGSNAAPCAGAGASCDPAQKASCAGSVASYCGGGSLASVDCSAFPLRSACTARSGVPCGPAGAQCSATTPPRCDGLHLVVCVNGFEKRVDCRTIGNFETCLTIGKEPPRCSFFL